MIKWDGHTHSEFCHHGSGEPTAQMVEKAIQLGFKKYSITEHAPLPPGVIEDPELAAEFTLLPDELPAYFQHLKNLKKRYQTEIEICCGLEVDFIPGYEDYFDDFLAKHRSNLDDLLVSIHMLKGNGGICPIDFTPESFQEGLVDYYGSVEAVHWEYWTAIKNLIAHPIDPSLNKRLGHLNLINKYQKRFPVNYETKKFTLFFEGLFGSIRQYNWDLDFNVAGMQKELYQQIYLSDPMLALCKKHDINLIYGSDAHGVESVGQLYDAYLQKTR